MFSLDHFFKLLFWLCYHLVSPCFCPDCRMEKIFTRAWRQFSAPEFFALPHASLGSQEAHLTLALFAVRQTCCFHGRRNKVQTGDKYQIHSVKTVQFIWRFKYLHFSRHSVLSEVMLEINWARIHLAQALIDFRQKKDGKKGKQDFSHQT